MFATLDDTRRLGGAGHLREGDGGGRAGDRQRRDRARARPASTTEEREGLHHRRRTSTSSIRRTRRSSTPRRRSPSRPQRFPRRSSARSTASCRRGVLDDLRADQSAIRGRPRSCSRSTPGRACAPAKLGEAYPRPRRRRAARPSSTRSWASRHQSPRRRAGEPARAQVVRPRQVDGFRALWPRGRALRRSSAALRTAAPTGTRSCPRRRSHRSRGSAWR